MFCYKVGGGGGEGGSGKGEIFCNAFVTLNIALVIAVGNMYRITRRHYIITSHTSIEAIRRLNLPGGGWIQPL